MEMTPSEYFSQLLNSRSYFGELGSDKWFKSLTGKEIDKLMELIQYTEYDLKITRRERDLIAEESEQKCELNRVLSKALDEACYLLSRCKAFPVDDHSAEEWKKFLKERNEG